MCGICGIVDFAEQPRGEVVASMTEGLRHRGPDMGGVCSFPGCGLGHRRLSILDLSYAAGQPMLSEDGKVALVFNGEIYNFKELRTKLEAHGLRFRTDSDTEVILALYLEKGEALVDDLNGMFSLAIWDDRRRALLAARDRLGKKPFYYHYSGRRLSFSSELSSLVRDPAVPREISPQALFEYLLYDFVPAPHTIFSGVHKLPAGHIAVFDADGPRIRRYWRAPELDNEADYERSRARLIELLEDAVRIRLVSDVPLGAFLSGGIDSTAIVALMRRHSSDPVKTFSIAFPGTTHDESAWAQMAADALGTDHRQYPVEYDVEGIFEPMVRHFGEPFGDSSAVPTWHLSEKTRRHVTVALSGDGGDELFGGYERYLARRFQLAYDLLPSTLRERVIEPLVDRLPTTTDYYGTSLSKKLKLFVEAARRVRSDPLAVIPRTFSCDQLAELTGIRYDSHQDPAIEAAQRWMQLDPVSRMWFTDIETYLAEDILTKVDRMSMAHALEVRSPFLDYRLVELACRLPAAFKLKGRTTKHIMRDAARELVPGPILTRSKYGFQVPLGTWFKNGLKEWARSRLFGTRNGFFQPDAVKKLWHEHQQGQSDHAHRIWLLLVFNEWYRLYG
ncbi:MAG: asparagine synthase (glutamine-hydrolyzing) [Desulfomonile sp.]|nr:asparagine synthase (glutamine-hydrolyzing) [Desulfomonile sp.]